MRTGSFVHGTELGGRPPKEFGSTSNGYHIIYSHARSGVHREFVVRFWGEKHSHLWLCVVVVNYLGKVIKVTLPGHCFK